MCKLSLSNLIETLSGLVSARGGSVLEIVVEDAKNRRLVAELCRGLEIRLEAIFGIHKERDRSFSITYRISVRWLKAEEMMRDFRPPSPIDVDGLSPEVVEARKQLYPIAQLRICEDAAYFEHPSPVRFELSNLEMARLALSEVVDALFSKIVPEFSRYCDPNELGRAAMIHEPKSHLLLLPINVAVILAAAGKWDEFCAWRQAYRNGFLGKPTRNPEVARRDEEFMEAIARHMSNRPEAIVR